MGAKESAYDAGKSKGGSGAKSPDLPKQTPTPSARRRTRVSPKGDSPPPPPQKGGK